ncbi:MAG: hypothetical protein H6R15_2657 [Proteobacteria bacterium]|nr:hypothetical protein [Pseudomonadota bacterium]
MKFRFFRPPRALGESPPPAGRGWRRRLFPWLAGLATLAAGAVWLGGTASGLRAVANLAGSASGGRLQIEPAGGRLGGPLQLAKLRWSSPDLHLDISGLHLDWSPGALLHGHLQIATLHAETLLITRAGSSSATPPPSDLRLPLTVDIENAAIARLEYGNLFVAHDLAGRLSSDGRQYTLQDFRAVLGNVTLSGTARLGADAPLPLDAQAEISGQLEAQALALNLQATGPLAQITVDASARSGLRGAAKVILTPFAKAVFATAQVSLDDFDPALWQRGAPSARLQLRADIKPAGDGVAGNFSIDNRIPGPLDHQRLPLTALSGKLDWQGESARLDDLRATLPGAGSLAGSGRWQQRALHLELTAKRLDASRFVSRLRPTSLNGPLSATLGANRQSLKLALKDNNFSLQAEASQATGRITLPRLELAAGPAKLTARGDLALGKEMAFSATGELSHFDPSRFARVAAAQINATFSAQGKLAPQPLIDGQFALTDSRWAGQPVSGQGRLKIAWPHIPLADIQLLAGANRLTARGAFGRPGDTLAVDLDAPQLAPYGLEGGINGHLELSGSGSQAQLGGRLHASRLGQPGQWRLSDLELTGAAGGEANSPLHLELAIATLETPEQPGLLKRLQVQGNGSTQAHRLTASADLAGRNHLTVAADGGLFNENNGWRWRGQAQQAELLAADKARNFRLTAPAALHVASTGWSLGPAQLAGQPLDWQATLQATADQRHLQASLSARGSRLGRLAGSFNAGLLGAWAVDRQAPWQGTLSTEIADLGWLAELIGEPWQSAGHFSGELKLAGTPRQPLANGRFKGEQLALRLPEQGLNLAHGELDIALANNRLRIVKFGFDSLLQPLPKPFRLAFKEEAAKLGERPGRLEISGEMAIDRQLGADQAFLDFHLERLGAWQLPDQWVAVSGDGRLTWQNATLGARGKLAVDAGYWQLAKGGTPQLSDDVVIKRPAGEKAAGLRPKLDIDLSTELGRHFLFSGAGLAARLVGDIRLRASGRDLPRASGNIRTVGGRFDAYGQQLAIERGVLTFQGLLDNPGLDVRAVRQGLSVESGVQISGSVRRPVVRLISDPDLPDAEKLAWLVLGHGPEQMGAGDASVLLSAASGLLGNDSGGLVQHLKKSFGVDEFGVRTGQIGDLGGRQASSRIAGSSTDSSNNTGQQIFSVGKRLSSKALLSYEQTLGKAESIVKLTVDLSRRISIVGRAGSDNAIDLFYTLSFGRESTGEEGKKAEGQK